MKGGGGEGAQSIAYTGEGGVKTDAYVCKKSFNIFAILKTTSTDSVYYILIDLYMIKYTLYIPIYSGSFIYKVNLLYSSCTSFTLYVGSLMIQ